MDSFKGYTIGHGRGIPGPSGALGSPPPAVLFNRVDVESGVEVSKLAYSTNGDHPLGDAACGYKDRSVRLIGITESRVDDVPGAAELLAYCARVSSTSNQLNHATGPKLLRSLIRRREWSPLEMVSLTMEITTTRDIARQILRHRSFSFQEFSQRYAVVDDEPVFREARLQDAADRQNSVEIDASNLSYEEGGMLGDRWYTVQREAGIAANRAYRWALAHGIAKEVARAVLPEGMTTSRLFMAGSLRSWIHYCWLRCDRKTQKEHRLIADQALEIICAEFPDLAEVLREGETS